MQHAGESSVPVGSKYYDPAHYSGIWFSIHTTAKYATTPETKKAACVQLRNLHKDFRCPKCKAHFGNHLVRSPPEDTVFEGEDALFVWTVSFHNDVNTRIGKKALTLEEARQIFYTVNQFCSAACEDTEDMPEEPRLKLPLPSRRPGSYTIVASQH